MSDKDMMYSFLNILNLVAFVPTALFIWFGVSMLADHGTFSNFILFFLAEAYLTVLVVAAAISIKHHWGE